MPFTYSIINKRRARRRHRREKRSSLCISFFFHVITKPKIKIYENTKPFDEQCVKHRETMCVGKINTPVTTVKHAYKRTVM